MPERSGERAAQRPAPLVLVAAPDLSTEPSFGTYAAVAHAGRRLLATDLSRRLGAAGAAVAPLEPASVPAGKPFHWGRWFADGARAVLGGGRGDGVDAIGYAGGGSLALIGEQSLDELLSAVPGEVVANNRFSADAFVVAGDLQRALAALETCDTDNAAIRCLEAAGFRQRDLSGAPWSRFDVDTPLDLALLRLATRLPQARALDRSVGGFLEMAVLPGDRRLEIPGLERLGAVIRDREAQLVVAGRIPSSAWGYLETQAACRVRCFVEERGMRSALGGRPRSLLADWAARLGAGDLLRELASLGDAVVLDTRVLMAALAGSPDAAAWPPDEERFASDFLDTERVATPWLTELTDAAATSPVPVLLGGHALISDGLHILVDAAWLGR
jgi:hypothetical protein